MSYHCSSSPMEEHKIENLWSERFQDLASWCHQPQDELNTPNVNNQNEFNFSFDDQSMYYSWEANSSSVDFKGDDMWKTQADLLPLQYNLDEDNNNSLMQNLIDDKGTKDTGIRYSGNLLLTQCPYDFDQQQDNCQTNIKSVTLETSQKQLSINTKPQNTFTCLNKRPNDLKNPSRGIKTMLGKPKPLLKLNIAAANKEQTPSIDIPSSFSMNTPDVLKSLSDDPDFSIISYMSENYDDQSMMAVDPATIVSQRPKEVESVSQQLIKIDHDYAEPLPSEEQHLTFLDQPLPFIKEEEEMKLIPIAVKEEPSSPSPSGSSLGKRIRKSTNTQDFIFEDDQQSDESSDWSPFSKKKCKTNKKKVNGAKQVKRARTSSISDSGSVTSGPDRYRELRDRNNEASRRSRQNRKQREVEMMEKSSNLQRENIRLKAKAVALEKRVKSLREILLKVVLEKNK